jgi:hypothetical protein
MDYPEVESKIGRGSSTEQARLRLDSMPAAESFVYGTDFLSRVERINRQGLGGRQGSADYDHERRLPSGWWILPFVMLGLVGWIFIIRALLEALGVING